VLIRSLRLRNTLAEGDVSSVPATLYPVKQTQTASGPGYTRLVATVNRANRVEYLDLEINNNLEVADESVTNQPERAAVGAFFIGSKEADNYTGTIKVADSRINAAIASKSKERDRAVNSEHFKSSASAAMQEDEDEDADDDFVPGKEEAIPEEYSSGEEELGNDDDDAEKSSSFEEIMRRFADMN